MNKIAIIGSGGAGKSTFARQISDKLNIEVYHLDAILWKPNWVGTSKDEQKQIQHNLVAKESWIIDGNYGGTLDIRLNTADTVIFLDIHRVTCIYRAIERVLRYRNKTRPDMGEGCEEKFDMGFLKWVWDYPKKKRPSILKMLEEVSKEKNVIILCSPKEVKEFIGNL